MKKTFEFDSENQIDDKKYHAIWLTFIKHIISDFQKYQEVNLNNYIDYNELMKIGISKDKKIEIIFLIDEYGCCKLQLKQKQKLNLCLLEDLGSHLGCTYLSDLKNPDLKILIKLFLQKQDLSKYTIKDLNDTVNYLTDKNFNFSSIEEIKKFFLNW